jgi:hypothetical protein
MRSSLRFTTILASLILVTTLPAMAAGRPYNDKPNVFRFHVGQFEPDGDSVYWRTREADFTGNAGDFEDTVFGADYIKMLNERWGAMFTINSFEGESTEAFLDFVDDFGSDILHTTTLETQSLGAGIVYHFLRRGAPVVPYAGFGLAIYGYDLSESGDFIDFDDFSIFSGTFVDSGETLGAFALVGVDVRLSDELSFFGEARWDAAEADLEGDFRGFGDIDLGGRRLSAGVSYRF